MKARITYWSPHKGRLMKINLPVAFSTLAPNNILLQFISSPNKQSTKVKAGIPPDILLYVFYVGMHIYVKVRGPYMASSVTAFHLNFEDWAISLELAI